jgi:hypothetical protein
MAYKVNVNWNSAEFEMACVGATMDRLEAAGKIVQVDAKRILTGQLEGNWKEHGPYKSGKDKDKSWTARYKKKMVDTIRVTRKYGDTTGRNVWIMAGNYDSWWAIQMEYGRGDWKGGKRSFLRPALKGAAAAMQNVIENGI